MTRSYVAMKVRESKEKNPEQFCPIKNCLWRIKDGSRCPKHKQVSVFYVERGKTK